MPNAQVYTDTKQQISIKYEIDSRQREIVYTVTDKDDTYYFSLLDSGLLFINKNDKPYVFLTLKLDDANPRYDNVQHKYVSAKQALRVTDMDAVMDAYERVKNEDFITSEIGVSAVSKKVIKFMDKYIFNTPESREILNEYLNRMRSADYRKREEKNAKYKKAMTKVIEKDKNIQDTKKLSLFKRMFRIGLKK